ncbi:MAG: serine hydrolase, partial [Nonlabens sp.]
MKNVFSVVILFFTVISFAQDEKAKRIDSLFTAMNVNNEFNGVVLFAEEGKIIHKKAYGKADFSKDIPLSTASVFDLASVS